MKWFKWPGIKKINRELDISDISIRHQQNKIIKENFDIVYFQKSSGKKLNELSEKNINKNHIHLLDDYKKGLEDNNITPYDYSFKSFVSNSNPKMHKHFIDSIIDQCISVEVSLQEQFNEFNSIIKSNRDNLVEPFMKDEISLDANINPLEYISDDIYGTTTMEWEIVEKEYIDEIIKNKQIKGETLSQKEAVNVRDWFYWSIGKSLEKPKLSIDLIKQAHTINTHNLDESVVEGLKYNPGTIRNELVNMGIFKRHNGEIPYMPPKEPAEGLQKFVDYFNTGEVNISKIANLHLVIYSLHPFTNGNKRTTRVLESLYIQSHLDNGHLLKWMWYWFKKNIQTYIQELRNVLSWKKTLKHWNRYYMREFIKMTEYSVFEHKNLKEDILQRIPENRHRYYDDKDKVFYRFYLSHKDNFFSIKDVNKYLNNNAIAYNDPNVINKRFAKHVKDELIIKTDHKDGKMAMYRFNI